MDITIPDLTRAPKRVNTAETIGYYYSAGSFDFSLEPGFLTETIEDTEVAPIPFAQTWVLGMLGIHGAIIPVINLRKFVEIQGIEAKPTNQGKEYLLKLEHREHKPIVFKLSALPKLIEAEGLTKKLPDADAPPWIKHYLQDQNRKIAVIDHDILFKQLTLTSN